MNFSKFRRVLCAFGGHDKGCIVIQTDGRSKLIEYFCNTPGCGYSDYELIRPKPPIDEVEIKRIMDLA